MCTRAETVVTTTSMTAESASILMDQVDLNAPTSMNGARATVNWCGQPPKKT